MSACGDLWNAFGNEAVKHSKVPLQSFSSTPNYLLERFLCNCWVKSGFKKA